MIPLMCIQEKVVKAVDSPRQSTLENFYFGATLAQSVNGTARPPTITVGIT